MTEKEKMLAGQLYDPSDKELRELRLKARKLARTYNNTDEDDTEVLHTILSELIPNKGKDTHFQAPIHFDYGCFTTFGEGCETNFNFTVLDCGPVTIGEGCVIGAGSVVTKDIPAHSLAVGNPCRVIRQITDDDRMGISGR